MNEDPKGDVVRHKLSVSERSDSLEAVEVPGEDEARYIALQRGVDQYWHSTLGEHPVSQSIDELGITKLDLSLTEERILKRIERIQTELAVSTPGPLLRPKATEGIEGVALPRKVRLFWVVFSTAVATASFWTAAVLASGPSLPAPSFWLMLGFLATGAAMANGMLLREHQSRFARWRIYGGSAGEEGEE